MWAFDCDPSQAETTSFLSCLRSSSWPLPAVLVLKTKLTDSVTSNESVFIQQVGVQVLQPQLMMGFQSGV